VPGGRNLAKIPNVLYRASTKTNALPRKIAVTRMLAFFSCLAALGWVWSSLQLNKNYRLDRIPLSSAALRDLLSMEMQASYNLVLPHDSTPFSLPIILSSSSHSPTTTTSSSSSSSSSSTPPLSREECSLRYGARRFLDPNPNFTPAVLYSYPGSGNTFTRLLIDHATGVYTGAILGVNDPRLAEALPGQSHCDSSVIAIKAHPKQFRPLKLLAGQLPDNCQAEGGLRQGFERFILLSRDPYAAIWSEYQRRLNNGSHHQAADPAAFDPEHFGRVAMVFAQEYVTTLENFEFLKTKLPRHDILSVKYEDLTTTDVLTREAVLHDIVTFLGATKEAKDSRRCSCAFTLADRPDTRRTREEDKEVRKAVTREEAYTPELACDMWELLEEGGAGRLGYSPPPGVTCVERKEEGEGEEMAVRKESWERGRRKAKEGGARAGEKEGRRRRREDAEEEGKEGKGPIGGREGGREGDEGGEGKEGRIRIRVSRMQ